MSVGLGLGLAFVSFSGLV